MEAKRYSLITMNLKPSHAEAAGHSATAPGSQTARRGLLVFVGYRDIWLRIQKSGSMGLWAIRTDGV